MKEPANPSKGENYEKENTCIVSDMCTGCRHACRMRKQMTAKINNQVENSQGTESAKDDQAAADEVAELIDAIYVQERTDKTDEQCAAAKEAWDKLTDAQKALVPVKMQIRIISAEIPVMLPRMIR